MQSRIESLVANRRPGWALAGDFFSAADIFERDLNCLWRTGWLFACHSCELLKAGDYLTLEVGHDPILILRDDQGRLRAFHNVCRHRGSLLCEAAAGHLTRVVCPYHQWTYGLDGSLLACRGMHEGINKAELGLRPVHLQEIEGLIFISLAPEPESIDLARQTLAPLLKPQGLGRARVAKAVDYLVKANWKLVWENNRECYHCNLNHPQYIKANFDHYNADDTSPRIREQITGVVTKSEEKWKNAGLAPTHQQTGMTIFPDAAAGIWFSANRTPLVEGYVSESMNGAQVAPLMGDYQAPDVGTLRVRTLPNFWNHSSCDHAVSTRLLPAGPELTAIRVWWLVAEGAVEGRDYDLAKLLPFWQLTSEQDWEICERQQRGVNSSAYLPGPYSTYKEYNVDSFVTWYLQKLGAPRASAPQS